MSSPFHMYFACLLLALLAICCVQAYSYDGVHFDVAYVASHSRGGQLFLDNIGVDMAKDLMSAITTGIWDFIFWQSVSVEVKLRKLVLFIDEMDVIFSVQEIAEYAYEIHISAKHLEDSVNFLYQEIHMLLTYNIAYALQWTGNGHSPAGLRDGIAAYVVMKMSYPPNIWVKYGGGNSWNERLDVTAQFLCYCTTKCTQFVEKLNKKMRIYYSDNYFYQLTDMTLDNLWIEYKTDHGHLP